MLLILLSIITLPVTAHLVTAVEAIYPFQAAVVLSISGSALGKALFLAVIKWMGSNPYKIVISCPVLYYITCLLFSLLMSVVLLSFSLALYKLLHIIVNLYF